MYPDIVASAHCAITVKTNPPCALVCTGRMINARAYWGLLRSSSAVPFIEGGAVLMLGGVVLLGGATGVLALALSIHGNVGKAATVAASGPTYVVAALKPICGKTTNGKSSAITMLTVSLLRPYALRNGP